MNIKAELEIIIKSIELCAKLRSNNRLDWDNILVNLEYVPLEYTNSRIDLMAQWSQDFNKGSLDTSLVLFYEEKPCGIWPLNININGQEILQSNGSAILKPLFIRGLSKKIEKKLLEKCILFIEKTIKKYDGCRWSVSEIYNSSRGISKWYELLTLKGLILEKNSYILILDLTMSIDEIWSSFRKSYRPLINKGLKLWDVKVVSHQDDLVWYDFVEFHKKISGRVTRSKETWDLQYESVKSGSSFLVSLYKGSQMVGCGLFETSRSEAFYSVGVYNRDLFDYPIGHVVQYCAIKEMKNRNLKRYCIGERRYTTERPIPNNKELSISDFKQGFSSNILAIGHLICKN